ncbi:uncharacterized protein METZ01_LOCUS324516, partial [marine metagenome]
MGFGMLCKGVVLAQEKTYLKRQSTDHFPTTTIKIGERSVTVKQISGLQDLLSAEKFLKKETGLDIENSIKKPGFQTFNAEPPDEIYENETITTDSPYINAEAVSNSSIFEAVSGADVPYHFYNTKYFTNSGTFKISNNFDYRTYETYKNLLGQYDVDPHTAKVFENKQGALLESDAPDIVNSYIR